MIARSYYIVSEDMIQDETRVQDIMLCVSNGIVFESPRGGGVTEHREQRRTVSWSSKQVENIATKCNDNGATFQNE